MQRYRPDIAWPLTGKPWPIMAEDSETGEYYAKAEVDEVLKRQAAAAISGMNAAKAISSRQLELAQKARAESSPAALESERQANAKLTQELSLAEEGLADYEEEVQAQLAITRKREAEIAELRNDLTAARLERDHLRALIDRALEWEPVFPLEANLIDEMWEAIGEKKPRSILGSSGHPTGDGS